MIERSQVQVPAGAVGELFLLQGHPSVLTLISVSSPLYVSSLRVTCQYVSSLWVTSQYVSSLRVTCLYVSSLRVTCLNVSSLRLPVCMLAVWL